MVILRLLLFQTQLRKTANKSSLFIQTSKIAGIVTKKRKKKKKKVLVFFRILNIIIEILKRV